MNIQRINVSNPNIVTFSPFHSTIIKQHNNKLIMRLALHVIIF